MPKIMVSGRIAPYVKEYFCKNNISISKALEFAFEQFRESDYDYAMKKLRIHEEKVLHYKQKVLHLDSECNTKEQFCITIKETFLEQGRGDPVNIKFDKSWLTPKVLKLQKDGIAITVDELYIFCKTKK
ncbi:MAG: hypothetical protein KAS32_13735 [Candidatus Peribacteraceae bacterium]|nr:hypothetical protein [Candidatus Peribacteraceae bacterium]